MSKNKKIDIDRICWNITNRCNDHCKFCFRNDDELELSIEDNICIAKKISSSCISHIAFSGGEALLYPGLFYLIEMLKQAHKEITLISNCIILDENTLMQFAPILNWIAIPFDTFKLDGIHTRNIAHTQNVKRVLNCIEETMLLPVKINTVLSENNYLELPIIYDQIICRYKCIQRWNIFEFTPLRGAAIQNQSIYSLSSIGDKYAIDFLNEIDVRNNLLIKYKHQKTIRSAYFVVSPQGNVILEGENSVFSGNLLTDSFSYILDKLDINEKLYYNRVQSNSIVII